MGMISPTKKTQINSKNENWRSVTLCDMRCIMCKSVNSPETVLNRPLNRLSRLGSTPTHSFDSQNRNRTDRVAPIPNHMPNLSDFCGSLYMYCIYSNGTN